MESRQIKALSSTLSSSTSAQLTTETIETIQNEKSEIKKCDSKNQPPRYAGFVAGVFSGITKLTVGHPFDTIKVRMQTSAEGKFKGPLDCLFKTLKNEGVKGLYKGATPPLVGWMVMDSV